MASMPARCSKWARNMPAGPAPMIATCVRMAVLLGRFFRLRFPVRTLGLLARAKFRDARDQLHRHGLAQREAQRAFVDRAAAEISLEGRNELPRRRIKRHM